MDDQLLMLRTFELALLGHGRVSPNPLVGAVIVKNGQIISEGYHGKYGDVHAERMAISDLIDPSQLQGATLYVNLEPCSHHGKTPPCADLIIQSGIRKVVVSQTDPNPLVNGAGIQKLRAAGIEVQQGLLASEAAWLNRRFNQAHLHQRPYVILKWAQSKDGYIGKPDEQIWLSNNEVGNVSHKWRVEEDAILVGWKTAQLDNPRLNVRNWSGPNPVRILFDRKLKTRTDLYLYDSSGTTFVYNTLKSEQVGSTTYVQLEDNPTFITQALANLKERNITSVIVEGGATLLQAFIDENNFDEVRIIQTNTELGGGILAPSLKNATFISGHQVKDNRIDYYQRTL